MGSDYAISVHRRLCRSNKCDFQGTLTEIGEHHSKCVSSAQCLCNYRGNSRELKLHHDVCTNYQCLKLDCDYQGTIREMFLHQGTMQHFQ